MTPGQQEQTSFSNDLSMLPSRFIVEESPDHLEEAVLIAMDEVSIREGEVQRMILRDCQGVGMDIASTAISEFPHPPLHLFRFGVFDLDGQRKRNQP
jgi:hypothetical protein